MAGSNRKISDYFTSAASTSRSEDEKTSSSQQETAPSKQSLGDRVNVHAPPYPDLGDPNVDINNDSTKTALLGAKWKDCFEYSFPMR